MLLKNISNSLLNNIGIMSNFIIVNIYNFSYFNYFAMHYNISHYNSFSGFNVLFDLFSGNNYFVFLDRSSYYNDLLDIFSDDDSNFELLAVCYYNYFVNYNNKFFNVSNIFFFLFFSDIFCIFFFFSFFFSKLMAIYVKINLSESKEWY